MKFIKLYRVLTFILLPFAALFALNAVSSLLISLSNPLLLLVAFIVACFPIYLFSSGKFLFIGILKAKPCNPKLKDWIKVNAIVSIIFAAFLFLAGLGALLLVKNPSIFNEAIQQMPMEQKSMMETMDQKQMKQFFKICTVILLPCSLIIIIHVILTFNLLKTFNYVFDKA